MDFEKSNTNIKKSIGVGHQAIKLKCIFIKFNGTSYPLPYKDTYEFLEVLSNSEYVPWWIIDRNLPRKVKSGDLFEFILVDEDAYKLNEKGEKVYKKNDLNFIRGQKVLYRGELYQITLPYNK